jgi:L-fucose mutarotase
MLKGISKLISPELLKSLAEMGHGDEIVLGDAHFPADTLNSKVIRADGLQISDLVEAILPLFELDDYVEHPILMMLASDGDTLDPEVEDRYMSAISKFSDKQIHRISKPEFYEKARNAYVVIMTGETAKYGNVLLKKGVTPC